PRAAGRAPRAGTTASSRRPWHTSAARSEPLSLLPRSPAPPRSARPVLSVPSSQTHLLGEAVECNSPWVPASWRDMNHRGRVESQVRELLVLAQDGAPEMQG